MQDFGSGVVGEDFWKEGGNSAFYCVEGELCPDWNASCSTDWFNNSPPDGRNKTFCS